MSQPTAGAVRAAKAICAENNLAGYEECFADIIDRETHAPELLEACKYALRFLNPKDHDVEFVKSAISKATEVR